MSLLGLEMSSESCRSFSRLKLTCGIFEMSFIFDLLDWTESLVRIRSGVFNIVYICIFLFGTCIFSVLLTSGEASMKVL